MNNVWVIFEINYTNNFQRMSSIHDNEDIAKEVAEYYRSILPKNSNIEYVIQNWTVVKDLKTITEVETTNVSDFQENKLVS